MTRIQLEKKILRRCLRQQRRSLDEGYRREADVRICGYVTALPVFREAGLIFTYVSAGDEVDTGAIIDKALAAGRRVAVPRCVPDCPGVMEACEIHSPDDLRPGAFGLLEPPENCPAVRPEEISLCIVPCLSADEENGARLGYGGGYYDRFLPKTPGIRMALCREASLSDGLIREEHDVPMDILVTENHVILYEFDRWGHRFHW